MANDPLDLWPESIQVAPLTPLKILQTQAARLKERTRGLLTVEVVTKRVVINTASDLQIPGASNVPIKTLSTSGYASDHWFEIVAPRLNDYRHQLFGCRHDTVQVYPVWLLDFESHDITGKETFATTQDEFTELVRKLLSSRATRSLISSLLARSAEADTTATPA